MLKATGTLVLLLARSSAQDCSTYTSCASCVALPQNCEWCPSSGSQQCYPAYSPFSCAVPFITTPPSCPAPVPPASPLAVALRHAQPLGAVALAAPALLLVLVLACTPVERACGVRAQSAALAQRPSAGAVAVLFLATALLWVGSLLFVVSPNLLWLVSITQTRDDGTMEYAAASTFYFLQCNHAPGAASDICDMAKSVDYVNAGTTVPTQLLSYINSGAQIGIVAYIAAAAFLLLPALMTSVATVRASNLRRYGVPAYAGGCSPASLVTALAVGVLGFVIALTLLFVAQSVASNAAAYIAEQQGAAVEYATMPGLLAMAAGVGLLSLGLCLTAASASMLARVDGVGCNGGGCCRLRLDTDADYAEPRYADAHAEPLIAGHARDEPIVSILEEPPGASLLEERAPPAKVPVFSRSKPTFMTVN